MPEQVTANVVSFRDYANVQHEVSIDVSDYMEASDHKMSLSQLYANKYQTRDDQPSALEQFARSANIRLRGDPKRGIRASTLKEIYHGIPDKSAGPLTRGTGSDRNTPAGRILFPEIMMQMINEVLYSNKEDYLQPWDNAIALRSNVTGPRADQPTVNVSNLLDGASLSQPISQLAEPATMVTITLNSRSYTIPTKAIGLMMSDEAVQSVTIDLVAIMLASQARGERIARIEADMGAIINGDSDRGINAVSFADASTFDSALGTDQITHRAWVKWLRSNYQKLNVTHALMTIDSALDVENRTGKPTVFSDTSRQANRFPADYTVENLGIPTPTVLLLPSSIVGVDKVVGFDRQFALHEITNVSASYSAIQDFVLRKATGMRFDYGTALFKLYDEAFQGLTLGA